MEVSKIDESVVKTKGKKKKGGKAGAKAGAKSEDFAHQVLHVINQVRENPPAFAQKIIDSIVNIQKEEKEGVTKIIFNAKGSKVNLNKGEEAFRQVATLLMNTSPVDPLQLREELVTQLPEDPAMWKNKSTIAEINAKKCVEVADNYGIIKFNMDLGVSDPELTVILQLVDDSSFKGKRRDNILHPKNKYLGVSYAKQKKKFFTILFFATEKSNNN